MQLLYDILVFFHLLSWALVLGLAVAGMSKRSVPSGLTHGALSVLITGVAMVGIAETNDFDLNMVKIAVKLVIAVIVTVLAFPAAKKRNGATWLGPIAALVVVNVGIAVFWG